MRCSHHSFLALAFVALACTACASPGVRSAHESSKSPVIAARGALPPAAGERAIDARLAPKDDTERIQEMVDAFRGQAETSLVAGNRVALLVDGPQTLEAIHRAIEAAQHHVHVETYIFADDAIGRKFRDLLILRRQQDIEVRVLYDAVGSLMTPGAFFDVMSEAGIEVRQFRPLDPVRTPLPWKVNNRDHRKIVVVDGRAAFTGGINISSTYASSSSVRPGPEDGQEKAWRDTHVQIDGPVAAQFQALFFETWTRAGGEIGRSPHYFPQLGPVGAELIAAVASDGGNGSETTIYATYYATIRHASRRIWMTQAYFAPNRELRQALIDAAGRGVDVRLIVPGFTDSKLIFHASRASYEELLAGGVRIYEQRHALLHAKTLVIDSALSMVGSANFDMRSFLHNNEVNAVIVGSDFARHLEKLFERDLNDAHEFSLERWRGRPWLDKLKEFGSSLFSYWL